MLLGTHQPRLDEKGRLVLPARFRDVLTDGVVLTKGQDRCVVLWPVAEFRSYADDLREASRSDARVRSYLRVLFSTAADEVPDRQGRITVPPALREYAGLDRDLVVVGANTTAEIWQPGEWTDYLTRADTEFSALDEEVMPRLPQP